ncbi:Fe-S cluster assembly protein SufB [Candidatus Dojkabacteria bacterium]|nr:Fe-S cluster assembly protein SufB [Candidatus Dojkabacteria bacterium]
MTEKLQKGISEELIDKISSDNNEPEWMRRYRHAAYNAFRVFKVPSWAPLHKSEYSLDFDEFFYYIRASDKTARNWDDVPQEIRDKYEKLGIPQGEREFLAGVGAQYESRMIYHSLREELTQMGVIFEDMNTAVNKYPELVEKYFGSVVPYANNKFSALNGAIWNGGSFAYIPKGVYVDMPLHNFFQMHVASQGQFEHTIIVAEDESNVEFLEGCVAPIYSEKSIHAGVVEIYVGKRAKVKFSTMQNWSKNVLNLVTKKALIEEDGRIDWVDGNVGSGLTMKYPALMLSGKGASGRILSLAFVGDKQEIDAGGKAIHLAPFTRADIESKAIIKSGGISTYRGDVFVSEKANNSLTQVNCVSMFLDEGGVSKTIPNIKIKNDNSTVNHESSILKISQEQLLYLQSRGLNEQSARSMIISGFTDSFTKELPMEYAVEFDRLVNMEVSDGVA